MPALLAMLTVKAVDGVGDVCRLGVADADTVGEADVVVVVVAGAETVGLAEGVGVEVDEQAAKAISIAAMMITMSKNLPA